MISFLGIVIMTKKDYKKIDKSFGYMSDLMDNISERVKNLSEIMNMNADLTQHEIRKHQQFSNQLREDVNDLQKKFSIMIRNN
jgi:hypothetical protein